MTASRSACPPSLRARLVLRAVGTLAGALVAVSVAAPTAAAHTGGVAINYHSKVEALRSAAGDPADLESVTFEVIGGDAQLQATNTGDTELLVYGYSDEPYLRIGPAGVFENVNSPATYLNEDRYAATAAPPSATPDAEPEWRQVSDGHTHAWHDHRIHWMAPSLPPQVSGNERVEVTVLDWEVPFELADQRYVVVGRLDWVPPPPLWPPLAASAGVLVVLFLALLRLAGSPARAGALTAALVAIAALVRLVDVAIAEPQVLGSLAVPAAVSLGVAGLAHLAWRRPADAVIALGFAAALLVTGYGLTELPSVRGSFVDGALPAALSRGLVAAGLMAPLVPALVWLTARRAPEEAVPAEPAAADP